MRKIILIAGTLMLAGCANLASTIATVESGITAGAAALCGIVPIATTIVDIAAALYPGLGTIVDLTAPEIQAVEAEICSAAPPATSLRFQAIPMRAAAAGVIGVSNHGVTVKGWRVR